MHATPAVSQQMDLEEKTHAAVLLQHNGGSPRYLDVKPPDGVHYQCSSCTIWYPQREVQNLSRGPFRPPSLAYSLNYDYTCSKCSPSEVHAFQEREDPAFKEFCATALANLMLAAEKRGAPQLYFSRDHSIVSYIEDHWDSFTGLPYRGKAVVQEQVTKALVANTHLFAPENDNTNKEDPKFTLKVTDFRQLNPHDFARLSAIVPMGNDDKDQGKFQRPGPKRKPTAPTPSSVPQADFNLKAFPKGLPHEFPTNKESYRYLLAECDRNSPLSVSYLKDPASWHGPQGRPIPGHMYRIFIPTRLRLSVQERAPQLIVERDGRTAIGDKGYSMVRATHSVGFGRYYFEFRVLALPGNAAVRAGWGTVYAVLQAPLGYDKFGYSYRSRKGTVFHDSKGKHYAEGYGVGDVIGCYIDLPPDTMTHALPDTKKFEPLVKFKNHLYFEVKDDLPKELQSLTPQRNSRIMFFKNGKSLGDAFTNIYAGQYFPCISLYKNATVKVNYGPRFDFPPTGLSFLPMSDRVHESSVEQTMSDMLYSITCTADFIRPRESLGSL
ncbi:Set1/Ash2 histone methyltransferase complex subunit ASH2 [Hypsibius exemplaris]|uniref:Set1/Ash2 histone methyltransferase complex subunit ASH2 n=1 Tax=Hypsibius exemplaris TaxID=2072580 RepID=A0A1W0X0U4_HYPEX|nr:Set1/Ash2 histone methyltransferase complex subunit ASH2 [Hypsibius exemplaris]